MLDAAVVRPLGLTREIAGGQLLTAPMIPYAFTA